jgi:hypothetical protein
MLTQQQLKKFLNYFPMCYYSIPISNRRQQTRTFEVAKLSLSDGRSVARMQNTFSQKTKVVLAAQDKKYGMARKNCY